MPGHPGFFPGVWVRIHICLGVSGVIPFRAQQEESEEATGYGVSNDGRGDFQSYVFVGHGFESHAGPA